MIDKLNALEKRYEELNALLADPAVLADPATYQKHAKSHSELHEIVEKFREYKGVLRGIEDTKALIISETDQEMRKLADEELSALLESEQECQQQL
jgi:peptide chain release factor 1